MFGLSFDEPHVRAARAAQRNTYRNARIAKCIPWSPTIKWASELNVKADTYPVRSYFGGETNVSPDGRWQYSEIVVPCGQPLRTYYGPRKGDVLFDGDVRVPRVKQRLHNEVWPVDPWMSLTPMEYLTLRAGTRLAKGHVVVAGLGLGHQLVEVSLRKGVKKITLVEKSQTLVDWILPEVRRHLGSAPVEVVIGDACKVLPDLTADIALVDVFPDYGSNRFEAYVPDHGLRPVVCPNISRVWCWGSASVP